MSEKLSTELDWSADEDSVIDVPTPVQSWDVPDGNSVTLKSGNFAVADFQTTAGNSGPSGGSSDPARSTRLALAYREPNDPLDDWTVFTLEVPIAAFNDLSLKDQQSGENAQNRRFKFDPEAPTVDGSRLTFEDSDEIALVALGPDAISGTNSQFSIDMDLNSE